jgi:ABC-2 type transport system ATP-binding protein
VLSVSIVAAFESFPNLKLFNHIQLLRNDHSNTLKLNMTMALESLDVDQSFRMGFWLKKTQVLHGVSLSVPEGAIFGFLGANGAGKTTLIHLITGLRKPTRGQVKVFGLDASSIQARSRIGYLPERPYFYSHLTGEGLLKYFGALAGMSASHILSQIPKVLNEVGMTAAKKVELKRYSKGMLQRIGIAQALMHDPEFLVLDEPMSGLDPVGRKEIRELIVKLAKEGRTVFFSSHVIPDVEAICDQVALMSKGRLIGCGPIGNFLANGPLQTEIAFRLKNEVKVSKLKELGTLVKILDGYKVLVSGQEEVSLALALLLKIESQVLWVTPIRPSLESLFESSNETPASQAVKTTKKEK